MRQPPARGRTRLPPREKRCPLRWEKMTRAPPRKAPGIFFRNKKIPRGKMPIYKMTRRKNPPASGGFWINAIRGRRGKDALKQARAVRKIFDKTRVADGETGKRHCDFLLRIFVVFELACKIVCEGRHIEMPMTGKIEKYGLRLPRFLAFAGLVHRRGNCVRRFGRRYYALRTRENHGVAENVRHRIKALPPWENTAANLLSPSCLFAVCAEVRTNE